ncbi:UDP-glycosyltransferase UGT5 isoform X2 [Drosophila ficusphila]|uniref:UDP-glycosyltransferase UGT5 isoform X2 n=1 Tax=Drosophila ficusphila TaxID=30025 RepID=UPI0007E737A2|nr:UDP-glycosyltransferase UGT5 isoform X2 [Drosophila ficusphila]
MRLGSAWLALSLLLHLELGQAANILTVFPYRLPSPFQMVRPLVRALVDRGHKVTMVSPAGLPADIQGVRHIRVPMLNKNMQDFLDNENLLEFFGSKWQEGIMTAKALYDVSYAILSADGVKKIMQDKSERFDMIMMEASHLDALYGLAEFYNATLVGVACMNANWNVDYLAGNSAPSVFEPISPMGYALDDSLISRWHNWIYITEEKLLENLVYRPAQARVFKKFFGYSAEKMVQLRKRFSVILVNSHFSMGGVRANVPNIIEVGGLHLSEPSEPCSAELKRFLDEAEHGVIYLSMGQDVLVKYLPDNMQKPLLEAFARLKQRVVWRSELSLGANKSEKFFIIENAPQRQLLSHPNVRLFITHGGKLSVMEAIDSGVPMLGLPLFYDQFPSLHRAHLTGTTEVLDANALDADILTKTIKKILGNPRYAIKAKEMSKTFRDRPMSPLETAIWWTEYALRHPNTEHMRLNEEEIPIIRYYRLDSIFTFGIRVGSVLGTIIFLGWRLYQIHRTRQRRLLEKQRMLMQIQLQINIQIAELFNS